MYMRPKILSAQSDKGKGRRQRQCIRAEYQGRAQAPLVYAKNGSLSDGCAYLAALRRKLPPFAALAPCSRRGSLFMPFKN